MRNKSLTNDAEGAGRSRPIKIRLCFFIRKTHCLACGRVNSLPQAATRADAAYFSPPKIAFGFLSRRDSAKLINELVAEISG